MRPPGYTVDPDEVIQHSYRNFHTKGFDYICLKRSPGETLKLYFFDGDISKLPEVVAPHDHRYDFTSRTLAGVVTNVIYSPPNGPRSGVPFHAFDYRTPLNGGNGFTHRGMELLRVAGIEVCGAGISYRLTFAAVHTIKIGEPETILLLKQGPDRLPVGIPTTLFTKSEIAPSLDGLYDRFTLEQLERRVRQLERATGMRITFARHVQVKRRRSA